jgi:ATP-dependent Clp protease ATP-binding subunit ClpA
MASRGYESELGARPLKRVIQRDIVIPISHYLLQHVGITQVYLTFKNNQITVTE